MLLPPGGRQVVVEPDGTGLRYVVLGADGRQLAGDRDLRPPLLVPVSAPGRGEVWDREADRTAEAVSTISRALLEGVQADSQVTATRLSKAFGSFRAMLWVTFGVGTAAFVAAAVKGLTADGTGDVVVTAVYGGLSATAFVAAFVSRPTATMGEAGLRAAWGQTIVTTYWSKLAYMNDPVHVLRDLDRAQRDVDRSMRAYFAAATPATDTTAGASGDAGEDTAEDQPAGT